LKVLLRMTNLTQRSVQSLQVQLQRLGALIHSNNSMRHHERRMKVWEIDTCDSNPWRRFCNRWIRLSKWTSIIVRHSSNAPLTLPCAE
jgi:hypothetical protein